MEELEITVSQEQGHAPVTVFHLDGGAWHRRPDVASGVRLGRTAHRWLPSTAR